MLLFLGAQVGWSATRPPLVALCGDRNIWDIQEFNGNQVGIFFLKLSWVALLDTIFFVFTHSTHILKKGIHNNYYTHPHFFSFFWGYFFLIFFCLNSHFFCQSWQFLGLSDERLMIKSLSLFLFFFFQLKWSTMYAVEHNMALPEPTNSYLMIK